MSGLVPDELVRDLLSTVGVRAEDQGGYLGADFRGTFGDVQKVAKRVRREGWGANTVLSQVRFSFRAQPAGEKRTETLPISRTLKIHSR